MTMEDKRMERVKDCLLRRRAQFCLCYRGITTVNGRELQWIEAFSHTNEATDLDELAKAFLALATHRWQEKRSAILAEKKGSEKGIPWYGFECPVGELSTYPANSRGENWWTLIVISGVTSLPGYVIVTRVLAKEAKECRTIITDIQAIIRSRGGSIIEKLYTWWWLRNEAAAFEREEKGTGRNSLGITALAGAKNRTHTSP